MDFQYAAEHDQFRESLRRLLSDQSPPARVREVAAGGSHDPRLWRRLCVDLEVPGLHIAEQFGGTGGSLVVSTVAFEELGRALTPAPLLSTVLAIEAVTRLGDEEQRSRLLPDLLSGRRIGSLAAARPSATTEPSIVRPKPSADASS